VADGDLTEAEKGPSPGWYPDPEAQGTQRYWDGKIWTDNRAPLTQSGGKSNGMAIASMVLGIVWLYWLGSVLALVFGYIALNQIKQSNGQQSGRGMAIAGIVLGWIGVAVLVSIGIVAAAGSN
jgi:Domain of unknown function (DUF4190)/Protein of unknown function (DUF2510)